MDKIATENLFLLEFLVDRVTLDPSCDSDDYGDEGEKCVSFQFLDNAPLDVCEADFNPQRNYDSKCPKDTNIKSGKSCLFSLSPEQAEEAINKLDIFVIVYKKMPPGWMPQTIDIGSALISIANLFEELINSITASSGEEGSTPTAKTLKDDFDISTPSGEICGKIGVYIRMSCFGKLIVTQFQMNLLDKSVLFKDKEGKSLYRYKKAGKGSKKGSSCTPKSILSKSKSSKRGSVNSQAGDYYQCTSSNATPFSPAAQESCVESCPFKPCLIEQTGGRPGEYNGGYNGGFAGTVQGYGGGINALVGTAGVPNVPFMGGRMGGFAPGMGFTGGSIPATTNTVPCVECDNLPSPPCAQPSAGYGGFGGASYGAPYGGAYGTPYAGGLGAGGLGAGGLGAGGFGAVGYGESQQATGSPCSECSPCPFGTGNEEGNSCGCPKSDGGPDGNYQEIGASMGGNSLTIRVHKDKGKVEAVDESTTESCVCGSGRNNMNVNMQPGIQQAGKNLPFAFKMGQQGQAGGNNVVVNPPICNAPDGAKVTEFSDPNKELFVLRIGKKSEGVDKKQNLELELCTPKGPELKPIPKKVTIDTQYDPKDAGPEGKKAKKGKEKGKGGKKKK